MYRGDLTQGEQNAIRRVSMGSEVGDNMWQDLVRKGLVERCKGKRMLTDRGRTALSMLP
jgi:ribosomal protein S19E (S16A)